MDDQKHVRFEMEVTPEEKRWIERLAERQGTSPQEAVMQLVEKAVGEEEHDRIAVRVLEEVASAQKANGSSKEETKPIWERIAERAKTVPNDVWKALPEDGAAELDHYLYGTPKRST